MQAKLNRQNNSRQLYCVDLIVAVVAFMVLASMGAANAYPTASIDFFSSANKLNELSKPSSSAPMEEVTSAGAVNSANGEPSSAVSSPPLSNADINFHQFINSKSTPESSIIGELKPNSSAWELMLLRSKIAETISRMQEADKKQKQQSSQTPAQSQEGAECFIEVTRVEKIPGKCHRANNGVPICQSENYMAINNDCN